MEKGNKLLPALDRWLGIAIVFILRLFRRKKQPIPKTVERIAILNLGSVGDNVLMSAVIADLRRKYDDAQYVAFTGSSNYDVVKLIPGIDQVYTLAVASLYTSLKTIKLQGQFDILFDFGPAPRINAIYSFFIKAKCKIGFKAKNQYRHYLYDVAVMHSKEVHELENYRNLVQLVNKDLSNKPKIQLVKAFWTDKITGTLGSYCIIHPWSAGYKSYMKEWPSANWAKLIELIGGRFDNLIITGTPSDITETQELLKLVEKSNTGNIINLCGKVSLLELTHLLSEANMIFSVNKGVSQMAAALGSRQVYVQKPTNMIRSKLTGDAGVRIAGAKGANGHLTQAAKNEEQAGNDMQNISPESVYKAYLELSEG